MYVALYPYRHRNRVAKYFDIVCFARPRRWSADVKSLTHVVVLDDEKPKMPRVECRNCWEVPEDMTPDEVLDQRAMQAVDETGQPVTIWSQDEPEPEQPEPQAEETEVLVEPETVEAEIVTESDAGFQLFDDIEESDDVDEESIEE